MRRKSSGGGWAVGVDNPVGSRSGKGLGGPPSSNETRDRVQSIGQG